MRIRVIINPSAGRQLVQKNADKVIRTLLNEGTIHQAELIETRGSGDAYRAAFDFKDACDSGRIQRVRRQPVNRFGGQGHELPLGQGLNGPMHHIARIVGAADINDDRSHLSFGVSRLPGCFRAKEAKRRVTRGRRAVPARPIDCFLERAFRAG